VEFLIEKGISIREVNEFSKVEKGLIVILMTSIFIIIGILLIFSARVLRGKRGCTKKIVI